MFEYHSGGTIMRESYRAVDSYDAFNAFRISHPDNVIAHVYVELYGAA